MANVAQLAKMTALTLATPKFDPVPEHRFFVFVDMGLLEFAAGFISCSGLSMSRDIYQYAEGGLNNFVHKLPGRTSYSNIKLSRGVAFSSTLWKWYLKEVDYGSAKRYNVTIMQYSTYTPPFLPVRFYHLNNAFPAGWDGPNMSVDSRSIAVESLELAFEDITIEAPIASEVAALLEIAAGTAARVISSAINLAT